jgi:hypothetical protein
MVVWPRFKQILRNNYSFLIKIKQQNYVPISNESSIFRILAAWEQEHGPRSCSVFHVLGTSAIEEREHELFPCSHSHVIK